MWIIEKASYRRLHYAEDDYHYSTPAAFNYPYDLGWRENVRQVFTVSYTTEEDVDGGIVWPVKEDCDQYTLTVSAYGRSRSFSDMIT